MTTPLTKLAETLSPNKRQLLELLLKEKEKARKA
jgi:predicted transcriptional regulator